MRAVGEARPATPVLEMKPFDKEVFHGFGGMPLDGPGIMREYHALAVVTGMGVSEMEHSRYSTQGIVFQRRSHQLRVSRSVNFSEQVR